MIFHSQKTNRNLKNDIKFVFFLEKKLKNSNKSQKKFEK